jgi:transposase InsO family protein
MLLRLAYLGITNAFALLRLLRAATGTRTRRSSRYATSSRCCSASSTGSGSGSTQPTGRGWPRCYTAFRSQCLIRDRDGK